MSRFSREGTSGTRLLENDKRKNARVRNTEIDNHFAYRGDYHVLRVPFCQTGFNPTVPLLSGVAPFGCRDVNDWLSVPALSG